MPESDTQKPQPVVTLKIVVGPVSPVQRQAYKRLWAKLVAECQEMTHKGGGSSLEDK